MNNFNDEQTPEKEEVLASVIGPDKWPNPEELRKGRYEEDDNYGSFPKMPPDNGRYEEPEPCPAPEPLPIKPPKNADE